MQNGTVSARLATESDEVFLREVFYEIRSPEFGLAEMSQRQLHDLLVHQFQVRTAQFAGIFPGAEYHILTRDGADVGYEILWRDADIRLIDIAVLPRFQNQAIGTESLRALLDEAAKEGKAVILSVEIFNPARRLFQRLGFQEIEDAGIYKRMRWISSEASSEALIGI